MIRTTPVPSLSDQVTSRLAKSALPRPDAPPVRVISTGSTLLDLAISGGRFPNGGIPGGILVEIFGPNSAGKTVLLCEIAGAVQRAGGQVMFQDPEARLNRQFAKLFGFEIEDARYGTPDTVTELFEPIQKWNPKSENGAINGIFADSLAALSTVMEMDKGDKMGMRRAKEFSEECRKVCRILTQRNHLMVCSNQVRTNPDARQFAEKFTTPGGLSIGFYASLRLRCHSPQRIRREREIAGEKQKRVSGVQTMVEVYKSSVWDPYHAAPVHIQFDYGIDDIRGNLEYLKANVGGTVYALGERRLGASIERAIKTVEDAGLEDDLRRRVVEVWHDVEGKFKVERTAKRRG